MFLILQLPNISKTSTFIANTPHPTVPKPKPEIKSLQLAAARKQQEMEKQRLKDENLKRQKQAMQRKLEEEQRKADDKKKDEDKKRSAESIQVAERDANLDKKRKIEKEPVKDRGREGQNSKPSTMAEYAKPAQISRIPSNMQPHSKAESSTKVPAPLVPNDRKESSSAAVDKPPDTKRPQAGLSKSASVLNPKTSGDQVPQSNAALQSVKTNLPPPPTIPIKNPYLSEITGSPLPRSKIPAIPPSPARSLQYCSSQISTFASLSQLPGTASSSQEPSSKGDTKVSGPSKTGEPIVESGVVTLVGDDGEIPDIHTSDEEDDEQPVAQWAASPLLMQSLERQMYKDPDEIFGMISPSGTREIFKGSGAKRMKQRRESAWGALDKLSAEEVSAYRKRMGFQ
ncbi:hypothetical protein BJ742DRAFT_340730 [Cladochytrium replicatum]|nr:hypothetical protein BJ742DRAFT_340730 [Cladochytrium replicatum]